MVMSKVGAIEAADATEYLTATLNGYQMGADQAMRVVDSLSAIDLAAATSVEELAEALQHTSNIARVNGVEFEELAGMIASVSEATRMSASVVGNSFKTIFSRLTNVAAGKDIDDAGEKLNDVEKTLNRNGIALRDSIGEWRDMYDVISEVGDKWQDFNDVQRDQISTAIAGTRQRETFLSLMENWEKAKEYTKIALESEGSANEKFQVYLDSIEAKLNKLKAAFEDLVFSKGTQSLFKGAIDAATVLLELLNKLVNSPFAQIVAGFTSLIVAITKLTKAFTVAKAATKMFSGTGSEGLVGLEKVMYNLIGTSNKLTKAVKYVVNIFNASKFAALNKNASMLQGTLAGIGGVLSKLGKAAKAAFASFGWIGLAVGAVSALIGYLSHLHTSEEEAQEAYVEASSALQENESAISALKEKGEDLNEIDAARLSILEAQTEELEKQKLEAQGKIVDRDVNEWSEGYFGGLHGARVAADRFATNVMGFDDSVVNEEYIDAMIDDWGKYSEVAKDATRSIEEHTEASKKLEDISKRFGVIYEDVLNYQELQEQGVDISKYYAQGTIDSIEYVLSALEEAGLSWEDFGYDAAEAMEKLKAELDEAGDGVESFASKALGAFETLSSALELVNTAEDEMANSGAFSIDTLNAMIERYPELTNMVSQYVMGLSSANDVMAALQNMYTIDQQNQYTALMNKLKMNQDYYTLVGEYDVSKVNDYLKNYGIDLSNCKSYAEAKAQIEAQTLKAVSSAWNQYYDAQTQTMKMTTQEMQKYMTDAEIADLYAAIDRYEQAMAALNQDYDQQILGQLEASFGGISGAINNATDSLGGNTGAAKENKEAQEALNDAIKEQKEAIKALEEAEKEKEDNYNDLVELTVKMLKKRKELEKEALKEQLEDYKKILDAERDRLDSLDKEYKAQKKLEEHTKNIAELEAKLAELQYDDSAEGKRKRLELEEELAEEKSELEDYKHDQAIEKAKDELDKKEQAMEDWVDGQIDEIDRYLSETGRIQAEAIKLVDERSEQLYKDLVEYNQLYGTSIEDDVKKMWDGAVASLDEFKKKVEETTLKVNELTAANQAAAKAAQSASSSGGGGGGSYGGGGSSGGSSNIQYAVKDANGTTRSIFNTKEEADAYVRKNGRYLPGLHVVPITKGQPQNEPKFKVVNVSGNTVKDGFTSEVEARAFIKSLPASQRGLYSVQTYSKGTLSSGSDNTEKSIIDEKGSELVVKKSGRPGRVVDLEKGSGVIPADITKRLWEIGTNPKEFFKKTIHEINGGISGTERLLKNIENGASLSQHQQSQFLNNIYKTISNNDDGGYINIDRMFDITVQGNLDKSVIPNLKEIANNSIQTINRTMFRNGYRRGVKSYSI